jgi:hypothetical protein
VDTTPAFGYFRQVAEADERVDSPQGEVPDDEPGRFDELQSTADDTTGRLQGGSTVSLLGATVPVRALLALGIFILVFMIAWTVLWSLGGTAGLALGWIPAAAAGLVAIRLVARSAWS